MHTSFRTLSRPRSGRLPTALLALLLALPAWAERRAELPPDALVTDPAELSLAADGAHALARRWVALAEEGRFDALQQQLAQAEPTLESEQALVQLVHYLRDAPVGRSKPASALLRSLAGRPPRVWMRHEETRGDWFVPALTPGTEANAALWLMARERSREDWVARLESTGGAAFERGFADPSEAAAAAEAVAMVSPGALQRLLEWKAASTAALPGPVLLALAERAQSPRLYAQALAGLDPARRVAVVAGLPERLPAADAVPLLQGLSEDAEVGSAAVLALGRFAADARVQSWLLDKLADPQAGPSAAAALARHAGAEVVPRLQARAAKGATAVTWTHVALALRLHGSPEAQRALEALARHPQLPAALHQELQP